MTDTGQPLKLIYLSTPDERSILNVQTRDTEAFYRFDLPDRDLFRLLLQMATALQRREEFR